MGSDEERLEEMLKSMMDENSATNNAGQTVVSGLDALKLAKEKELEEQEKEEPVVLEEEQVVLEEEPVVLEEEPVVLEEEPIVLEGESNIAEDLEEKSFSIDDMDFASMFSDNEDLADIKELLDKSDNHEMVSDTFPETDISGGDILAEMSALDASDGNEIVDTEDPKLVAKRAKKELKEKKKREKKEKREQKKRMKSAKVEEESFAEESVIAKEDTFSEEDNAAKEDVFTEEDNMPGEDGFAEENIIIEDDVFGEEGKTKKKKKKAKKEKAGNAGFLKKLGDALFGVDGEESKEDLKVDENTAILEELAEEDKIREEKGKKKKEKKGKKAKAGANPENPDDEEGSVAKESPKEKKKREKKELKEQKKKEKQAAREAEALNQKPKKKISKKKIAQVFLLAATFLIVIFLLQKIGMGRLELAEARNAFFHGDYETAYHLFAGDTLNDSDKVLYDKASVIVRLQHVCETYDNHKQMDMKLQGLDDLMQGLAFYYNLIDEGKTDLLSQQAMEEYHRIVGYLQFDFSLSEEEARSIVSEEDDYIYSLRLEAIAEGKPYIPPQDSVSESTGGKQNVNETEGDKSVVSEENSTENESIIEPMEVEIHLEDALPEEEGYKDDSNH